MLQVPSALKDFLRGQGDAVEIIAENKLRYGALSTSSQKKAVNVILAPQCSFCKDIKREGKGAVDKNKSFMMVERSREKLARLGP